MQNNFEKQVRQKMEELSFNPAPPVWQHIESQIRITKERRRGIIWLLMVLLLTGAGSWFWYYNQNRSSNHDHAVSISSVIKENKKVENQSPSVHEDSIRDQNNTVTLTKGSILNTNNGITENVNELSDPKKTNLLYRKNKNDQNRRKGIQQGKRASKKVENVNSNPVAVSARKTRNSNEVSPGETILPEPPEMNISNYQHIEERVLNTQFSFGNPVNADSATLAERLLHNKLISSNEGENNKIIKRAIVYKWKKSLVLNGGISGSITPLKLFPNAQLAASSRPPVSTGGSYLNGPSTDNGNSFSVGMGLQKKLSKRINFNTGLLYNYASTVSYVGSKVSQNITVGNMLKVDQYFYAPTSLGNITALAGTETPYHNSYHFISIPLSFEYLVSRKLPIVFNAGLSVKQLIYTNALVYDDNIGIFYNDKSAFRHTQLSAGAGIEYSFHINRLQLQVGPYFDYGISKTVKTGDNNHLFFLGLATKLFIAKKKQ